MPILTRPRQALLLTSVLLGGCSMPPSLVLFGAAFPDWLFCVAGGVIGMVLIHMLLGRYDMRQQLGPLALSYPMITALLAVSLWLVLFRR
ncbi:YtcA family lipoprotein [Pseudomonas sp. 22526]|uniref:YtcA family lipoprotein n=1 Tax=Pseudomonas sp. 22526 TaxID=3453937 RepID=UPI003F85E0A9